MSIKVITHVWEQSKQKGSALLMMLAIADNANDEGEAWPSLKTLAHKTRMSKRNAQMVIKKLEESGELAVKERREKDSDNETNLFTINVPWRTKPAKSQRQGVKSTSPGSEADYIPGGEAHFMPGVKPTSPKPSLEPSLEPIAPEGAEVKPSRKEEKPHERNPLFDAVALQVFGIAADEMTGNADGGRIGAIAAWLAGTSDGVKHGKGKLTVGLISKPAEAKHIEQFAREYKAAHPNINLPKDFEKFVEAWRAWASSKRAPARRPVVPVMTEPTEADREALLAEIRATKPAWKNGDSHD